MFGPCLGEMIWGKLTRVILLPFGRNRLSAGPRYLHEFLDAGVGWAWDSVLGIEWFLLFLPFHIKTIRRTDPGRRKNNGFFQEWKSRFFMLSFMHHLFRNGSFIIICFEYWHLKALLSPASLWPILSFWNNLCHFKLICVWSVSEPQVPGLLSAQTWSRVLSITIMLRSMLMLQIVIIDTITLQPGPLGPDAPLWAI